MWGGGGDFGGGWWCNMTQWRQQVQGKYIPLKLPCAHMSIFCGAQAPRLPWKPDEEVNVSS